MLRKKQNRENSKSYDSITKKKKGLHFGKNNISSRKYGQVKLRASRRGIYSCLFAILAFLGQCGMLYYAYKTYGAVPAYIGSLGIIMVVGSALGIYYGFLGFREREKNYWSCKIGIISNSLMIIGYIILFIRGLV